MLQGVEASQWPQLTAQSCEGLSYVGREQIFGGEEEDRTPDLGIANAALSQLSYFPAIKRF